MFRQRCLEDIETIIAGKEREDVEADMKDGRILFDRRKYTLKKDSRWMCGFVPDFTPEYAAVLEKCFVLDRGARPTRRALKKLDKLLSEGYRAVDISEDRVVYTSRDVDTRRMRDAQVIHMVKDSEDGSEPMTSQIVVSKRNGRLFQGSQKMLERRFARKRHEAAGYKIRRRRREERMERERKNALQKGA